MAAKTKKTELIARVREMESRYDALTRAVRELDEAVQRFSAVKPDLDALRAYHASGQWLSDFEADEAGKIPADVKRGVLSEDGLYNLLQEVDELARFLYLCRPSEHETLNV
ncbi:MAG: DUF4298 domain-containing protein [Bacteroidales bacterium]|nr:DUF4298 domain-containing protein [Bacteroidales bacterium]